MGGGCKKDGPFADIICHVTSDGEMRAVAVNGVAGEIEIPLAIPRFILPEALFWFRWGAMATIVFGLILAQAQGYLFDAIKLGIGEHRGNVTAIGFGMWLGTIMWFNVWFIIWPNQQKVLGLTPADDAAKKSAARTAGLASRVNTMLSIPMLYGMAAGSHGVF